MQTKRQKKQEKQMLIAYLMMMLTIVSLVPAILAFWFAARVAHVPDTEVWLNSHAFWVVRCLIIFICIFVFAILWFIPLLVFVWDQYLWVTFCLIMGVIFALIAWLYLLNTWLKGVIRYFKKKPVY